MPQEIHHTYIARPAWKYQRQDLQFRASEEQVSITYLAEPAQHGQNADAPKYEHQHLVDDRPTSQPAEWRPGDPGQQIKRIGKPDQQAENEQA
jgi:hypothetical protein